MSRKTGKPSYVAGGVKPSTADRKVWSLVGMLALAVAIGAGVGLLVASPSSSEASIAAIRKEEVKRDKAQIIELTAMTRGTKTALMPVVSGLAAGKTPTADQLTAWKAVMLQETQRFAVTVSGMTGTNVARGGFRNAVDMLSAAVDTYVAAQALPADSKQTVVTLALKQKQLAVSTWSVAATQLDQLNNDAGNGHQHVYLTDSTEGGSMTSDGAPEGPKP